MFSGGQKTSDLSLTLDKLIIIKKRNLYTV